jgi:hypothetical protein
MGLFDLYLHHRHTKRLKRIERNQREALGPSTSEPLSDKATAGYLAAVILALVWLGLLGWHPVVGIIVGAVGALGWLLYRASSST